MIIKTLERRFLLDLIPKNGTGIEIGVWKGEFSFDLLQRTKPKNLYLVDPWAFMPTKYKDKLYKNTHVDSQHKVDKIYERVCDKFKNTNTKIIRKFSVNACNDFPDRFFDWAYIDGNHDHDFVKDDLEKYSIKTKGGGYICGDDYHLPDVKKAVTGFLASNPVSVVYLGLSQFILRIQ